MQAIPRLREITGSGFVYLSSRSEIKTEEKELLFKNDPWVHYNRGAIGLIWQKRKFSHCSLLRLDLL